MSKIYLSAMEITIADAEREVEAFAQAVMQRKGLALGEFPALDQQEIYDLPV